jgi:uncharacterized protein (UPF0333 family)
LSNATSGSSGTAATRRCGFLATWNYLDVQPRSVSRNGPPRFATRELKIQVYTHVENVKKWKKSVGWNTTTIHDVKGI